MRNPLNLKFPFSRPLAFTQVSFYPSSPSTNKDRTWMELTSRTSALLLLGTHTPPGLPTGIFQPQFPGGSELWSSISTLPKVFYKKYPFFPDHVNRPPKKQVTPKSGGHTVAVVPSNKISSKYLCVWWDSTKKHFPILLENSRTYPLVSLSLIFFLPIHFIDISQLISNSQLSPSFTFWPHESWRPMKADKHLRLLQIQFQILLLGCNTLVTLASVSSISAFSTPLPYPFLILSSSPHQFLSAFFCLLKKGGQ